MVALSGLANRGWRAAASGVAMVGALVPGAAPAQERQVAANARPPVLTETREGCGLMNSQQRHTALGLLDAITDRVNVSAPYLKQLMECIDRPSATRPMPVTAADKKARQEIILRFVAEDIPVP